VATPKNLALGYDVGKISASFNKKRYRTENMVHLCHLYSLQNVIVFLYNFFVVNKIAQDSFVLLTVSSLLC